MRFFWISQTPPFPAEPVVSEELLSVHPSSRGGCDSVYNYGLLDFLFSFFGYGFGLDAWISNFHVLGRELVYMNSVYESLPWTTRSHGNL